MAATIAAVLRLPLAAVVIALLLTSSAGAAVTPLIIVAAVVSYVLVEILETAFALPEPKVPAAAGTDPEGEAPVTHASAPSVPKEETP